MRPGRAPGNGGPAMRILVVCVGALAAVGCSSTNVSDWVGSWTAAMTETDTCSIGTSTTPLNGTLAIAAGGAGDTIVTQPLNACDLKWTVSGDNASLESGQSCTLTDTLIGTGNATFTSGGLTLSGNTIAVDDKGTAVAVQPNANSVQCTFVQAESFTR
jgi:hypothetical protein